MPETIAGSEILSLAETRAMMRKKLRGFLPEFYAHDVVDSGRGRP